ncbi:MAG: SAM-dependent methyltransferase, partial [Candidatus Dormibacteria bacterium]
ALTAALASSGFPASAFCFLGFLPRTAGKLIRVLEDALREERTIAFFESPMRIAKTLRLATPVLGERPIVVARELTKLHETLHRGTAATLVEEFTARPPRGECTVVVGAHP